MKKHAGSEAGRLAEKTGGRKAKPALVDIGRVW